MNKRQKKKRIKMISVRACRMMKRKRLDFDGYISKIPFKPYLYNMYGISNEFVSYRKGTTPKQSTVHGGLMDVYMDCYNNNDLEKFDKIIENLNKSLNSPKIFGEDDYFWLLDVIDNATCFNDPIEEVIDYIDKLLTDCGYDVIQVYQHILDKDEFVVTYPSENAEVCLKAMGQSVAKTVYDFTKQFKDIARVAMSFHPELVDNKKA